MSIAKKVMTDWVQETVADLERLAENVSKETVSVNSMVTDNFISISATLRELPQNKEDDTNVTHK